MLITAWLSVDNAYAGRQLSADSNFAGPLAEMYALGLVTPPLIYVAHVFPPARRPRDAELARSIARLHAVKKEDAGQ